MANGVSKLQLLIDLRNRLGAGLNSARQQVERATGGMQRRLDAFSNSNSRLFSAIEDRVPGVSGALGMLANPYVLITAAVLAAGMAMVKFTGMANDWRVGLAEVNVTAGMTQTELDGLSTKLLEIGGRNVAPLEEVPKAFNRIISAGLDVNTSLQALEPTLRAAKAGFADVETTAMAAVSVMNSSGRGVNEVYDVLFQTVKDGNAKFKDIAQYLPKIIPVARNVGFALDETAGAYASLTTKLSAEASSTALEGIMRSFSDKDRVKAFKGIGVNIFDKKGMSRSLIDIMSDLEKEMSGLTDKQRMLKFGKLGLDQAAVLGLSTLIQDMPNLKSSIDATVNSQGALNKAYADAATPFDDFKQVLNLIKIEAIGIGAAILPVLSAIGKGVLFLVQNLDIIGGVLGGLAIAWSIMNAKLLLYAAINGILAVKTGIATAAQWAFNIAASANPIGLIVLAIGALIGGLVVAYNKFDKFRAIMQVVWEVIKEMATQIGGLLKDIFTLNFKGLKEGLSNFKMPDMAEIQQRIKLKTETSGDFTGVNKDGTPVKPGVSPIAVADAKSIGSGSQTKSVTINIDSFVKGFSPTSQSINGMNKDELERWMTEMFMRVVRSAETAM